jgi:hypothetical protein
MKIPRSILKVAAVCSSLLLGGGLIAYRSGALPWLETKPVAPPEEMHLSSSKYATVDVTTISTIPYDHSYLAGSKSMPGIITVFAKPAQCATATRAGSCATPSEAGASCVVNPG